MTSKCNGTATMEYLVYFSSKSRSNIIAASEWNTVAECTWNLILNDIERSVQNYSAHIFVKITCVN